MKKFYYPLIIISMLISFSACSEDEMYDIQYHKYNYNNADKMPQRHNMDSCIVNGKEKMAE